MLQLSDKAESAHLPENLPKNRTNIVASMLLPNLSSFIWSLFPRFSGIYLLLIENFLLKWIQFKFNSIFYVLSYFRISLIVESLEFVMAQFLWYSWVALNHKFTFRRKQIVKDLIFLLKLKSDASTELHIHEKTNNKRFSFHFEIENRRTDESTKLHPLE